MSVVAIVGVRRVGSSWIRRICEVNEMSYVQRVTGW